MQNKLQELTDRLYSEGLSKGQEEGKEIVQKAETESKKIIEAAHTEADRIIAEAQKAADDLMTKVTADTKMAVKQSITATKQEIVQLIALKSVEEKIVTDLNDEQFIKKMITTIVAAFNPADSVPVDIEIILPESMKQQIGTYIAKEIHQQFKSEVKVTYSKKINGGFTIAPKGESYILKFTDEEFTRLISEYMRPLTKKILFG